MFCKWDRDLFVPINMIFKFLQEALRLQQDVRKKKQEILEKHIETQKVSFSSENDFYTCIFPVFIIRHCIFNSNMKRIIL